MANKELTAKVKLDSSDAEAKLNRLHNLITKINKAVTGHSNTSQLETKLSRELITAEKVAQQKLKTKQQQEKLAQEIGKTFVQEEKVNQALSRTKIEQERVKQATSKTAQEIGKEFVAEERVNQALIRTEQLKNKIKRKTKEVRDNTESWVNSLNKATGILTKCKSIAGSLISKMTGLAGKLLSGLSLGVAIHGADQLTGAQNRFNNIASKQLGDSAYTKNSSGNITGYSDKALQFTQDTMDKIYTSAQKTRVEYADMLSNVSKTMTLAPDAFQGNIDNAIRFQEIMAEAYAVGGASAQEMSTSMYQLTQALGAGTLAGDELRSVREGAPLAYQKIEEFAQGVLNTTKSLKDLASQGEITSDMVVAAVMSMGNEMDQAFALTKYRFTDVWNQIKSAAQKTFSPVVEMMTDKLNEMVDNGLIQKFETFFANVAKFVMIVFNAVEWLANKIVENWDWIKDVLISGLILIMTYELALLAITIMKALVSIQAWYLENTAAFGYLLTIIKIVAIIGLLLIGIYLLWQTWSDFANGACTLGEAIIRTLLIIGVIGALIALILGAWLPALIILGVALILAAIVACFGTVCGVVAWVGATIWNIVVGVVNAIIQFLWTYFVEPWIGIIEWVLNVFNGGFDSFGDGVKNLLGNIISWFLSLGQVVTKIIDAIFGTNWTGGLEALKNKVLSWGKNENAITLSREAPEVLKRVDATDAFNSGYNWGSEIMNFQNKATDKTTKEKDKTSWLDEMGNKLGLTNQFDKMLPTEKSLSPNSSDELLKGVGNTADNTGKMADSMELAEEDLEYLRKIAAMEWKKEFTTATIQVDMSNYNTINGEDDLDGIVTKLSDKLKEELNVLADGVYA